MVVKDVLVIARFFFGIAHFTLSKFPNIAKSLLLLFRALGISTIVRSTLARIGFWEQPDWVAHKNHPNLNPSSRRVTEVVNWLKRV